MTLPTIEDFTSDPENDLDGAYAWRLFGGLSVDEAYDKFSERPDLRQEDFMFMGDAAFVFYFSVIDRHIRENEPKEEFDAEAHILALAITAHVSRKHVLVRPIYGQIIDLCHFVLSALKNIKSDEDRSYSVEEVELAWTELLKKTSALM